MSKKLGEKSQKSLRKMMILLHWQTQEVLMLVVSK